MPECIFTCPKCGYQVRWNNEREVEPECPNCRPGGQRQAAPSAASGGGCFGILLFLCFSGLLFLGLTLLLV